jgi:hypothetical protein
MSKEINAAVSLIQNHFSINESELILQDFTAAELEIKLSKILSSLLNQDMERLLHAFYRIDLDEQLFKKILTEEAPDNISLKLAQEVIKRELEKVKTREKYRSL